MGKISPLFMSGPSAIAIRFWDDLLHGNLLSDLAYSGKNFAIGFVLAALAGVVFGVVVGWYRKSGNAGWAVPECALCHASRSRWCR